MSVAESDVEDQFDGIYSVPEVARYLSAAPMAHELYPVESRRLIRWIRRGLADRGLQSVGGRELFLTFEDVVSMRVIAALRAAGVSFSKIYRAERWLREQTGAERPFATQVLWTDRSHVLAELQNRLIMASRHGQIAMDLLRTYLIPVHGLTFGPDRLADTWEPVKGVVLDPEVQFGAPCIKGSRIPTRSVWGMVEAGDPASMVADAYGISEELVEAAVQWERALAA